MDMLYSLGRKIEHDPRSRRFAFAAPEVPLRKKTWRRYGLVLNQGPYGACTGFAMGHALNSLPHHTNDEPMIRFATALDLYTRATQLDEFPGEMPEQDTGSSGLGVAKAARERGYISAYNWAFGLDHTLASLMASPVLIGSWWYEGMFQPDAWGFVRPLGDIAGGHEYLLVGIDPVQQVLTFQNSWGSGWGIRGRFYMKVEDFRPLLADGGDALIPVS